MIGHKVTVVVEGERVAEILFQDKLSVANFVSEVIEGGVRSFKGDFHRIYPPHRISHIDVEYGDE